MTVIRQWLCGLTGHEELLKFHQGRMHLTCSCGWESPGWQIAPNLTLRARRRKAQRIAKQRRKDMHVVQARRIA